MSRAIRGQILLLGPSPPPHKVFSLVSLEEKQRKVGSGSNVGTESAGLMAKAQLTVSTVQQRELL